LPLFYAPKPFLQQVGMCVQNFIKIIGMMVNHSKTELILFTKKRELLSMAKIKLTVGNTKISSINSIKALGVNVDKNLDWNSHINALQRRFSSRP